MWAKFLFLFLCTKTFKAAISTKRSIKSTLKLFSEPLKPLKLKPFRIPN